jgi:hypothetical protein
MISPGSCRANSNPLVFRVSFGFIIAREDCPVIAPRVTFLRERFWANGFELDQTVENPEPFLAPLPSCERFLQKVSHYRDLALVLEVIFQISSMAEGNVLVCVYLLKCFPQTWATTTLSLAQPGVFASC